MAASQFNLLTALGLREHHTLLDIGCGSLRAGRLFIPYLADGRYYGIEPNPWLVEEGVAHHLGQDLVRLKRPTFGTTANFALSTFGLTFDYILAQSVFSHAAPAQIERCLGEARGVMHPRSIFAATFYRGDRSHAGTAWTYPGNVRYRLDDMQAMIAAAGLRARVLGWTHPNGQTWLVLTRDDSTVSVDDPDDRANLGLLRAELERTRATLERIRGHRLMRALLRARRWWRRAP